MVMLNALQAQELVAMVREDGLALDPQVVTITGRLGHEDGTLIVEARNPRQKLAGGRVTWGSIAQYARWRSTYPADFRAKMKAQAA